MRNVISTNIDIHDQPSRYLGCIVLPTGVAKIFQIRKVQRFDKSDTDISDLVIECFDRDKSCKK